MRPNTGWFAESSDTLALPFELFLEGDLRTLRAGRPAAARLNGNRIEWIPTAEPFTAWMPPGKVVEGCLDEFCCLADSPSPERVLAFVMRYGALELIEGGAPACGISELCMLPQLAEPWQGCMVEWEPVAAYVVYARSATLIRRLASALRASDDIDPHALIERMGYSTRSVAPSYGVVPYEASSPIAQAIDEWVIASGASQVDWADTPRPGSWYHLFGYAPVQLAHHLWPRETLEPRLPPASVMRRRLAQYVQNQWVEPSGLTPRLEWSGERACLALGIKRNFGDAPPLFRVLALQLLAAVIGEEHAFTCSHCGSLGYRPRKPRTDQNVHCDNCRPRAGSIRNQRHRQRRRASPAGTADDPPS